MLYFNFMFLFSFLLFPYMYQISFTNYFTTRIYLLFCICYTLPPYTSRLFFNSTHHTHIYSVCITHTHTHTSKYIYKCNMFSLYKNKNKKTIFFILFTLSIYNNLTLSSYLTFQKSYSFFRFLSKTVSSYLPTQVTDVFSQGRAFASVTLPEAGIRRMCAITKVQKQSRYV